MGVLTRQELEECNAAFDRFDQSKGGSISVTELRNLLKDINQLPDEDELFDLLLILNLDTSGSISRNQFIELVEQSKKKRIANIDEKGTIEAFVVCGGQQDKTGSVSTQKIAKVFKEFELSLDIDSIMQELDQQGTGQIDYFRFASIFQRDQKRLRQTMSQSGLISGPKLVAKQAEATAPAKKEKTKKSTKK